MAGRNGSSKQHAVKGRGKNPYTVTISYDTGHWCTCRGMLSMKKTYQEDAGRTHGTSCKHIKNIIKSHYKDDWGKKVTGGFGRRIPASDPISTPTIPAQPTGRRAAIMAQRARRENGNIGSGYRAEQAAPASGTSSLSLLDRIAALESAREGVNS